MVDINVGDTGILKYYIANADIDIYMEFRYEYSVSKVIGIYSYSVFQRHAQIKSNQIFIS
jgi:hypothetical protein